MSFTCFTCRDTRRVTQYPRHYGMPPIGQPCPDCETRRNQAQANEEMRARMARRNLREDRIDELRRMYPMEDEG